MAYKPTAGVCEKCGYGKTWDVRLTIPGKTARPPAHIDENGALLGGTGECGFYAAVKRIKGKNSLEAEISPTPAAAATPLASLGPLLGEATEQQIFAELLRRIKQSRGAQ